MPPLRAMEWVSHLVAADGSDRSREIGQKTKHLVVTSKRVDNLSCTTECERSNNVAPSQQEASED